MQKTLTLLAVSFFAMLQVQAQTSDVAATATPVSASKVRTASTTTQEIDWENFDLYLEPSGSGMEGSDWAFYLNIKQERLFVDFAAIAVERKPMRSLRILSSKGEQVFQDAQLTGLPSDAIYEVDLRKFAADTYQVEVVNGQGQTVVYALQWDNR